MNEGPGLGTIFAAVLLALIVHDWLVTGYIAEPQHSTPTQENPK